MGFTRRSVTCFFSSCCSQWSKSLHSSIITHQQQCLRQEKEVSPRKLSRPFVPFLISQEVDLVAIDFNGAAWRCRSRDNLSTNDEVFADCALPTPPGPTLLWAPGSIPNNWADVCGFLKPPGSQRFWKVSEHGAFSKPRQALGLCSSDQSCHHETWLHLHFVEKWSMRQKIQS